MRWIGKQIPSIRYIRAIPNRILKPIHKIFRLGGGVVDVMGFVMRLDPQECVDGNLWFAAHLYDRLEIDFLLHKFPKQGVFLDVGANIGFWSLRFAHVFPEASVYAIEANPSTYNILCENIQLNNFCNIKPIHVGVFNEFGVLPLYLNNTGNRGGDTFIPTNGRNTCVMVPTKPLISIINDYNIPRIDAIKIDIEGLEEKTLECFFREAPRNLWPHFICAEISHILQLSKLLYLYNYHLVLSTQENSVFELIQAKHQNE